MVFLIRCLALAGLLLVPFAAPLARAGAPVAVVEEVRGRVVGVELMDYVSPGQVINLAPQEVVVLGYIASCLRETITGGTVIVMAEQSLVQGGRVQRTRVDCDARQLRLTEREATQSAATVYRNVPREPVAAVGPVLTVHGRTPIIEVGERRGQLVIEAVEPAGETHLLSVTGAGLLRGRFLDLAGSSLVLTPGVRYHARLDGAEIGFRIDAAAKAGATPAIGRLVRFD